MGGNGVLVGTGGSDRPFGGDVINAADPGWADSDRVVCWDGVYRVTLDPSTADVVG